MLKVDRLYKLCYAFYKFSIIHKNSLLFKAVENYLKHNNIKYLEEDLIHWFSQNEYIFNELYNTYDGLFWDFDKIMNEVCAKHDEELLKGIYKIIILSLNKSLPNLLVKEEHYLKGYKSIPLLYLLLGNYSNYENLSLDLSHNFFITKFLKLQQNLSNKEIEMFIEKYKNEINNIRKYFDGTPIYLGAGVDGVAFKINEHQVLKIFSDKKSYNDVIIAQDNIFQNKFFPKTEAMIYDSGIIGSINEYISVYYYIIEYMNTESININDDKIINSIQGIIITYYQKNKKEFIKNKENIQYHINEALLHVTDFISVNELNHIKKIHNLNNDWLENFVEENIIKLITDRTDLHTGNLGVTNYGQLRYFDPSISY